MITPLTRVRIEVLVDAPIAPKLAQLAREAGITGHTLIRTVSGEGRTGRWAEDLVSGATAKMIFLAVANRERTDRFVDLLRPLLDSHGLLLLLTEAEVIRGERF